MRLPFRTRAAPAVQAAWDPARPADVIRWAGLPEHQLVADIPTALFVRARAAIDGRIAAETGTPPAGWSDEAVFGVAAEGLGITLDEARALGRTRCYEAATFLLRQSFTGWTWLAGRLSESWPRPSGSVRP